MGSKESLRAQVAGGQSIVAFENVSYNQINKSYTETPLILPNSSIPFLNFSVSVRGSIVITRPTALTLDFRILLLPLLLTLFSEDFVSVKISGSVGSKFLSLFSLSKPHRSL